MNVLSVVALLLAVFALTGLITVLVFWRMERRLDRMQVDIRNAIRIAKQATGDE